MSLKLVDNNGGNCVFMRIGLLLPPLQGLVEDVPLKFPTWQGDQGLKPLPTTYQKIKTESTLGYNVAIFWAVSRVGKRGFGYSA
jgi:uncharacterized membrane protein